MRTVNHKLVLAVAAIGALAACARQEIDVEQPEAVAAKQHVIHFSASMSDTKTTFGEGVDDGSGNVIYRTYWTENDSQVKISLNYESSVVAAVNPEEQDESGNIFRSSFDAAFDGIDTQNPYKFYVVSPASALLWPSAERGAVSVHILAQQTPTAASIDEAAQIIVAESASYTTLPDAVDVHFGHLTGYGKLTLKNVNVPQGASVKSVTLLSEDQPLSGDWYYKFEDGSFEQKESSSSLIIKTDNINIATDPVWFACAPVDMSGKSLKVYVNFSNGKALYREITLKSGVQFVSGGIYKFSVNMASAELVDYVAEHTVSEDVYQLVTSINNLSRGDEVIFLNSYTSPQYAMSTAGGTSGLVSVAKGASSGFTVGDDGFIRLPAETSVAKMTVGSRNNSTITFKNGSNNLSVSSSGSGWNVTRYLSLSTSNTSWSLSISTAGSATMSYSSGNRTYYVRYNSNYFNINTSTSSFAIYKKVTVSSIETVDMSNPVVLQYDELGAYLPGRNLLYNATSDQLSREYNDDETLTFAILAPEDDKVLEFNNIPSRAQLNDHFEMGLTFISGVFTEIDETYSVAVVKEEGHILWLADTAGNGFIVKR